MIMPHKSITAAKYPVLQGVTSSLQDDVQAPVQQALLSPAASVATQAVSYEAPSTLISMENSIIAKDLCSEV